MSIVNNSQILFFFDYFYTIKIAHLLSFKFFLIDDAKNS